MHPTDPIASTAPIASSGDASNQEEVVPRELPAKVTQLAFLYAAYEPQVRETIPTRYIEKNNFRFDMCSDFFSLWAYLILYVSSFRWVICCSFGTGMFYVAT